MNLETVETHCLAYLKQASDPLVPVSSLLRFLRQKEGCKDLDEDTLLKFLRPHAEFHVLEPPGFGQDEVGRKRLRALGFRAEPMVILKTRIPPAAEINRRIGEQMEQVMEALVTAAKEAHEEGDEDREKVIRQLLERAVRLREKFEKFS